MLWLKISVASQVERGTLFSDYVSVWVVPVLAPGLFFLGFQVKAPAPPFSVSSVFNLGELLPKSVADKKAGLVAALQTSQNI